MAALGVVVLVVAVIALRHPSTGSTRAGSATATPTPHTATPTVTHSATAATTSRPATTASSTRPPSSSSSSQPPAKLPLIVLNNTTTTGLARDAAQRFEAGGWPITRYGNYQNEIISTCAYYDPSVPGAHESALALQSQFPTIKRVQPRFAELPSGPIVVVLTPDYS